MNSPKYLLLVVAGAVFLTIAACSRPPERQEDSTSLQGPQARLLKVDSLQVAETMFDDLSTHRLILNRGKAGLLVERGKPEEAEAYYTKVNDELEISNAILQSSLDDLFKYCGYSDLNAAAVEVTDSVELMRDAGIQATVFFAPKIVDVSGQTVPLEYGWRKLIRLKSRALSHAEGHNISSMWLLFNFFSKEPKFPGGRAGQIQAILESSTAAANSFPVYFFVYENNASAYKLRFFLNASFDGATKDPSEKYYVPRACAQCHGDTSSEMKKTKVNYLDTDHWFDRTKDDFTAVLQASVLPDGGAPGSSGFDRAFEVYRLLNTEIASQNRSVDPTGFQVKAVENWIKLHRTTTNPIPPLERGVPGDVVWTASEPTDAELLPLLNQYCFRCHSSFEYHVFDKTAVKNLSGSLLGFYVQSGLMPQDRKLGEATKSRLITLLEALDKQ